MENLEDDVSKIEKSIEDCNEHYEGMLEVYHTAIKVLREGKELASIENLVSVSSSKKSPHEAGVVDGYKKITRILEEMKDGLFSEEETLETLEYEVSRIEKIIYR